MFDKIIFYSDKIIEDDIWKEGYKKLIQHGNDLGEKMMHAFDYVFKNNYQKAVIIGTDCPRIN